MPTERISRLANGYDNKQTKKNTHKYRLERESGVENIGLKRRDILNGTSGPAGGIRALRMRATTLRFEDRFHIY